MSNSQFTALVRQPQVAFDRGNLAATKHSTVLREIYFGISAQCKDIHP
jgi:hypothetical protein